MVETLPFGAVAIGRNEGNRLNLCLRSLLREQCQAVVYVDSASIDGSTALARSIGVEVVDLDLSLPFTAARARAEGFARLLAIAPDIKYVMFVDGDCELQPDWIGKGLAFLELNPEYGVVCGRRRERFPDRTRYNTLIDHEWNTPIGPADACGGDALYAVRAYSMVGGFNAAVIAGEEPELCFRLRANGWQVMRIDAEMTLHDADMNRFTQWWTRAVRCGFAFAQTWLLTHGSRRKALFGKELLRIVIWAAAIPCASVALALLFSPITLLFWPAIVAIQFARMRQREGSLAAALSIIGKYAELYGVLTLATRLIRGRMGSAILYK